MNCVLFFDLLYTGFNLVDSPASLLGAKGNKFSELFNITFFFTGGILTLTSGIGLFLLHHKGFAWTFGSILMVLSGIFLFLTGVFPTSGAGHFDAYLHGLFSQYCFALASIVPLFLIINTQHLIIQNRLKMIITIVALIGLLLELTQIVITPIIHYPYGYFQRSFMGSLSIVLLTLGVWLKRHRIFVNNNSKTSVESH